MFDVLIFAFTNVTFCGFYFLSMISLPEIKVQRLAVKLTSKAEKLVKQGHPWVFDKSIIKLSKEGKAGSIVHNRTFS